MRRKVRVIQINGIRGLLLALSVVACLIAGFVAFPGLVAMHVWNFFAAKTLIIPPLGFIQGVLLWGIIAVSVMIVHKQHVLVSFKTPTELSGKEIDEVMERIKRETTTKMMTDVIANSVEKKPSIIDLANSTSEDKKDLEVTNKNIDN